MNVNYSIWKIFYLIFTGAIILIITLLYHRFYDVQDRYHAQIRHYTEIISKTIHSDLLQKDMLLEIIGKQLLDKDNYKNKQKTQEILDNLLKLNPYLVGFGLFDVNGRAIIASTNVKTANKINLLKNKTTEYYFKKSLKTTSMVVGRTNLFKVVNKWIIPLRKAIRDTNGNVLAVMATGLKNEKNTNYLDSIKLPDDKAVVIIKDIDDKNNLYRQYFSKSGNISSEILYNTPLSKNVLEITSKIIKNKYNFTVDDLKLNGETMSIKTIDSFSKIILAGITYDKKYNLWIIVKSDYNVILDEFFKVFITYISLFIASFIVIFFLFKNISSYDRKKKKALIFQAQHDTLTSLPNIIYMYANIDKWRKKHTEKFDILYIDLDNFKNINDKFGHKVGDKVLIEVAKRLQSFFSKDDMLIRQGGDEFIVFRECIDDTKIDESFLKLINLISKTYHVDKKEFRIGMSMGIARFPKDALIIEELLSLADTAMYNAKKRKNSYSFFSEKMRHKNIFKTDIEQELRSAIEKDELWMVYQPQINADGTLYGVEALIRWENEKLGLVGPDKFISVAEDTGLIKELGEFIISTSLKEIKKIQSDLNIKFSLSINISVIQLMEFDFLKRLLSLIKYENFDKSILTIEITESLSIEDLDESLPLLNAIKNEGIEISLDDFGTGYSSLSILKKLPINELKIDKSFIDEILYDEREKALVKSIINIGKNFGMKTLAEGVESLEQVEELKNSKCDIFQGYYFSKPLNKDDLIQYLHKIKDKNDRR